MESSEVKVVKSDGNDSNSSAFFFSITLLVCYSDASEWLLDRVQPIPYVQGGNDFLVLRNWILVW